ncbi:hypothetical protein BN2475_400102 [Paraburkholderia ribeironis]|uniref:Uncharacterized protein n=2 Tax=Paraburkholderia ribeironis TaxID=1247936 RepID=A0A1N7S7Z3_9BURK|nr:hypothetical protein BN2475_400102 [Paraburkholderia ribeironis]
MMEAGVKGDAKTAVKSAVKPAMKPAMKSAAQFGANAGGWPVDDITGLVRRLPELDPASYFDAQSKESYQQSLTRWPLLARLMNLVPRNPVDAPAAPQPAPALKAE